MLGGHRALRPDNARAAAAVGTAGRFHGTDILWVEEDRLIEYWLHAESLALMAQLQVGVG
ncbi:hypothetical protein ACHABQ_01225 [Nesterenkonia aurantiaca]|uniref:hypothetical protein n=1 Tax=Nesterenkonia aurantiaca TaxID=1436010 RepID=UPI003EE4550E